MPFWIANFVVVKMRCILLQHMQKLSNMRFENMDFLSNIPHYIHFRENPFSSSYSFYSGQKFLVVVAQYQAYSNFYHFNIKGAITLLMLKGKKYLYTVIQARKDVINSLTSMVKESLVSFYKRTGFKPHRYYKI